MEGKTSITSQAALDEPQKGNGFLDKAKSIDIDELSQKVAKARESRKEAEPKQEANSSGMALGMRMASEFVSAILVGGLFGFGFDHWLKSSPIGMMAGLGLGFAAGVMNLIRASREYSAAVPIGNDMPIEEEK